ncbi:MAG: hypothetical protein ABSG21_03820 [Spirochaetia bacterium]|jgi:hypothetical protein
MDNEGREKVALFRFGVISSLVARKGMSWGEREELIRGIVAKSWEIPGSPRSFISRSTVLHWLTLYERGGSRVEALQPRVRCDRGTTRALDAETEAALVALKRELPAASLPVLLKMAPTSPSRPAPRWAPQWSCLPPRKTEMISEKHCPFLHLFRHTQKYSVTASLY